MNRTMIDERTLLSHAVKVEQDGYRFYIHLAKAMPEKRLMDLFFLFAEDEQRHEMTFKKMLRDCAMQPPTSDKPCDPILERFLVDMEQYGAQLLEKGLQDGFDRNAQLGVAIQLEKDSILFYGALKAQIGPEQRPLLETIIDEELRHLTRLFAIRQGEIETEAPGVDDL